MSSKSIFQQHHAARTSRLVTQFDGVTNSVYSSLAVGSVSGARRQLPALVSVTATDHDVWRVVNLKSTKGATDQFDSVAVLGAVGSEQAVEWAIGQHGRFLLDSAVVSVAETNAPGLMRYLNSKDLNYVANAPVHPSKLQSLQDVTTIEKTLWDGIELKSHNGQSSMLLLDLVKNDDHSQLFDAIHCDDMPDMLEAMGVEVLGYDSLIVESRMLDKLTQRLSTAMSKATEKGVTVVNSRQSEPFKRNKVTQVMAIFEMSDGQSISIVFHNPDSTPSKLLPNDVLISWKFLLNSRDVSAAVQPNQGEDVQLPVLATRIMKLVNQNSARFQRTAAKKVENLQELENAKGRIETKTMAIADLDTEIARLQTELDKPVESELSKPVGSESLSDHDKKLSEFGGSKELQSELVKLGFDRLRYGWLINESLGAWRGSVGVKNAAKEQYVLSIPESIYNDIPNAGNYPFQKKGQESYQDLAKRIFDKGVALNKNVVLSNSEPSTDPAPQPTPAVEPESLYKYMRESFDKLVSYGWKVVAKNRLEKEYGAKVSTSGAIISKTTTILTISDDSVVASLGGSNSSPRDNTAVKLDFYEISNPQDRVNEGTRSMRVAAEGLVFKNRLYNGFGGIHDDLPSLNPSDKPFMISDGSGTKKFYATKASAVKALSAMGLDADGLPKKASEPEPTPEVKPDPTAAMRAGKMQAHLNQSIQTTDGKVTTIGKLIDLRISQGGRPVEKSKRDPAAEKRLMTEFEALARNAPIGNSNHPDTIRLNELKAMKKDPSKFKYGEFVVTVPSYFLEGKDGASSMVLTKTGFDYAKSVVANMPAPTPIPEESPMPATNPDAEYLQSIVDGTNQGTDKESRAKVREILTNAKAASDAEIEALANTAVQQIASRVKAAAQAKLAEVA